MKTKHIRNKSPHHKFILETKSLCTRASHGASEQWAPIPAAWPKIWLADGRENHYQEGLIFLDATCCRDLPRAPTLPSITYSGFSKRQYTKNTSVEALLHQKGTTYNDIYIPTNTY